MSERPAPTADDIEPVKHETLDRIATGTVTVIPFLALGAIGWQAWADLLGWSDIAVFAILYVLTGLGITVGFHRHLTHRAFATSRAVRGVLAALGSAAIEGPVISWVADHRKHHAFADREGDPHSPHVGHGSGWRGALSGLLHAHVGWLFIHTQRGARDRYAPDLIARPRRELHRPHVRGLGPGRVRRGLRAGGGDRRNRRGRPHRACSGAAPSGCSSCTT